MRRCLGGPGRHPRHRPITGAKGFRTVNVRIDLTNSPRQARKRRTVNRETAPVTSEAITPISTTLA